MKIMELKLNKYVLFSYYKTKKIDLVQYDFVEQRLFKYLKTKHLSFHAANFNVIKTKVG